MVVDLQLVSYNYKTNETLFLLGMAALLFSFEVAAQVNVEVEVFTGGAFDTDVHFVELNGDNTSLEVLQGNPTFSRVESYAYQSANNTWNDLSEFTINLGNDHDIEWYDYDGDGDNDIATISRHAGLQVFENDGSGNFTNKFTDPQYSSYKSASCAAFDRNNDGIEELYFTANIGLTSVELFNGFLEYAAGTDSIDIAAAPGIPPTFSGDVASGNLVGSDAKDLVILGGLQNGSAYGAVLQNNADQTMTEVFMFTGLGTASITIDNIAGTSANDFAIMGVNNGSRTMLFENLGGSNFLAHDSDATNLPNRRRGGLAFADLNGDGIQDCFITGDTGTTVVPSLIHLGLGDFIFDAGNIINDPVTNEVIALTFSSTDSADFDNDGDDDIIFNGLTNNNQEKTYIIRNQFINCGNLDTDNDGLGDLCDEDDDNDGNPDATDPNPLDAVTQPDSLTVISGDTAATVDVLANDDFEPGTGITLTDTGAGTAAGTVTIDAALGTINYTPTTDETMQAGGSTVTIVYEVANTNVNPIVSSTNTVTVTVEEVLSLDELSLANNIRLFPNPAHTQVSLQLPGTIVLQESRVYNTLGQEVARTHASVLQVAALSSGVYFVKIATDQGVAIKRLLIQ